MGIAFVIQSGNGNKVGISYIAIYFKSLFLCTSDLRCLTASP